MWLCEYKFIINHLFSNELFCKYINNLKNNYIILNYLKDKPKNWY